MVVIDEEIEKHFAGKEPAARELYCRLLEVIKGFGPVIIEPKKTCLHLVNRTALAGVYVRRGYINLDFKTDHPLVSDLISKSEQISKSRFHHVVKLTSADMLDGDLRGWLSHAYAISG